VSQHFQPNLLKFFDFTESDQETRWGSAIALYQRAFPPSEKLSVEILEEKISNKKFQLIIGEDNSEVIAIAVLCPLSQTNFILLGYLAIDEKYRGQGIGKHFMDYLKTHLKAQNKFLLLEVEHPQFGENRDIKQKRINFYYRLGAKSLDNIRYLLPNLAQEKSPEMLLMIYPKYPQDYVEKELVRKLIRTTYQDFYNQKYHSNIDILCHNIPDKTLLSSTIRTK